MVVLDDIADEAEERQAEERLLSIYRRLRPDLKKMMQLTAFSANLVEQERQKRRS